MPYIIYYKESIIGVCSTKNYEKIYNRLIEDYSGDTPTLIDLKRQVSDHQRKIEELKNQRKNINKKDLASVDSHVRQQIRSLERIANKHIDKEIGERNNKIANLYERIQIETIESVPYRFQETDLIKE